MENPPMKICNLPASLIGDEKLRQCIPIGERSFMIFSYPKYDPNSSPRCYCCYIGQHVVVAETRLKDLDKK